MGAAAMAYVLWTRHLRFNPKNPKWPGRDRFILSGGHGSALLYSLLYLTGYDLPIEQLMNFRQWGSLTPGHPEYGLTPGVEVTTGPLGQGFANGVGMAIAQAHLAAEFNRPGFDVMQSVLLACTPGASCPPEGTPVNKPLLKLPASVGPAEGDKLVDFAGPLPIAATLAQNFLLEYTNAMGGNDLGWGRVNEANLREMMSLHGAYSDLLRRTPYLARTNGSNLLSHILRSIEQAAARKKVRGALGTPGDKLLLIVGHDTNVSNVAGMLSLSWLIEGYQRDDTPPGGALVFELWRHRSTGEHTVRTYYMAQTLEQMRGAQPLTLTSPPAKAPTFVPGCGTATQEFACTWNDFRRTVEAAIDPAFVKR